MKKSMRILSGFLSCLLLLTGCSPAAKNASSSEIQPKSEVSTNNTQTAVQTVAPAGKGMFVATKVGPEGIDAVRNMTQLADGSLMFYTENMAQKYVSQDNGSTWQAFDGPQFDVEYTESISAVQNDGTTYAVLTKNEAWKENGDYFTNFRKVSPDGSISSITIPEMESYEKKNLDPRLGMWRFLNKERLFIAGQHSFGNDSQPPVSFSGVYNPTTYEKIYDLDAELFYGSGKSVVSDEKNMYILQSADNGTYFISVLSLADGTEQKIIALPKELNIHEKYTLSQPKNGLLYLAGSQHIYQINLATAEIIDKGETSQLPFANRMGEIISFITLSENELLCASYYGHIWQLVFDENYQPKEDDSLIIWSLRENRALRDFATTYQDQNPDSIVKIEYGFTYNQRITPIEKEDYIRGINTRLLAGDPVDIIVLDNLPAQQYAQQGLLADMTSRVDTSDFLGNFAKQLQVDNHLYYVPLSWFVPVMQVRKDATKNMPTDFDGWMKFIETTPAYNTQVYTEAYETAELDEWGRVLSINIPLDKMSFLRVADLQNLYDMLWVANEPALLQKNKINEENMKSFLKAMKLLADKDGLNTEEYLSRVGNGWDPNTYNDPSLHYESDSYPSISTFEDAYKGFCMGYLEMEQSNYSFGSTGYDKEFFCPLVPAPSMAGGVWKPYQLLGISTKSTKKDTAAKFIQLALSPTMQIELNREFSIPITKASHLQMIENEKAEYRERVANLTSEQRKIWEETGPIEPELEDDEQNLLRFAEQLKAPLITDYAVRNMVWEPMRDYTRNLLSLEEAMNQINSKTKIYLSEKAQ